MEGKKKVCKREPVEVKETGGKNKERAQLLRWAVHCFSFLFNHIRQNKKEKYFEDRFMIENTLNKSKKRERTFHQASSYFLITIMSSVFAECHTFVALYENK